MNKLFIGISGSAGAGKDTLCDIFIDKFKENNIAAVRMALADPIKAALRDYLFNKYGIDILNCSREDKDKVRQELVSFGKEKRRQTNGRYFTDILFKKAEESDAEVIIISDVRYTEFLHTDEVFAIKERDGLLIHLSRYDLYDGHREYIRPANPDEARNEPMLLAHSDFQIDWQTGEKSDLSENHQAVSVFNDILEEFLARNPNDQK